MQNIFQNTLNVLSSLSNTYLPIPYTYIFTSFSIPIFILFYIFIDTTPTTTLHPYTLQETKKKIE